MSSRNKYPIAPTGQFIYFGVTFEPTGKDDVEIGRRVVSARKMIECLNEIFCFQERDKKRKYVTEYKILLLKVVFYTGRKHGEHP